MRRGVFSARVLHVLVLVVFSTWAVPALAQKVLVVRPPQDDPLLFEAFGRLNAELALQGFEVVVESGQRGPLDSEALELAASRKDAFAAISLRRDREGTHAEVHIVDRVTGKTVTRRLKISSAKEGPMLLAVRAADLLRTSLLELGPGERPPEDVVGVEQSPPSEEVLRFSRRLPRFQIAAGAMASFHPALGIALGGAFAGGYRPTERLMIGVEFAGPLFGGQYRADGGAATIRQEWGMVRGTWNIGSTEPGSRWEWGPALGMGLLHLDARGDVAPPLVAEREKLWTFVGFAGVHIESYFNERVSLGFTCGGLGLIPQPVVAVGDERSSPTGVQGAATLRLGVSF